MAADRFEAVQDPRTISAGMKAQVEEADTVAKLAFPPVIAALIHQAFHYLSGCRTTGQVATLRELIDAVHSLHNTLKDTR